MHRDSILVVDDEPGIRQLVGQILQDEGYDVQTAASGEEALKAVQHDLFDLILLDIWLPGIDGVEVLKRLKASGVPVPVIVISGHASAEQAVAAIQAGAHDFLEKPLSYDRVLVSVRNTIKQFHLERRMREVLKGTEEPHLTGNSPAIENLRRQIMTAAPTDGRVLITGANGTGKEVVARMLHRASKRATGPFIAVNCAAIPSELIESELFGHLKGAFTGAVEAKRGKFELADGGTLFLDEIGDMSLLTQAKVLRVLQEQRFTRLGGSREITVDVRVIAATNKDLEEEIAGGRFRRDLYYRLNVIPIRVPPLAERREDIPALVEELMGAAVRTTGARPKNVTPQAMKRLMSYAWPGNVRELKNVIERLVIMVPDDEITSGHLSFLETGVTSPAGPLDAVLPLREARARFEREYISAVLARCDGNVTRAARELGLERSHLHRKLRQLQIDSR
ncbi:MAG: sigma-54-dependent Fis family transcriptional regulator [Acidobacteria bacterium]|nr:sigma-54-dependent Fis family transcriptional regulator [Acidobacteriota bacterium]